MASRTAMLEHVRTHDARRVAEDLAESPELLDLRDARGRGWLHLCCAVDASARGLPAARGPRTAGVLLDAGLDIDAPAFREGSWRATPLWYAVARGHNRRLARFLLERGADPNHCLWAAAHRGDLAAIRMLVRAGAEVDPVTEDETPFLHAVKHSHFDAAKLLLTLGADPDFRDTKGMTALHYMLRKGSDVAAFRMIAAHGARGDLCDARGRTAAEGLRRKRDPAFHRVAERLARAP